ncbi:MULTISPECIES: DUF2938 domain-containing protein [unclassified Mesorhizobium]|uniref:DUF2938 domain-containing protein n=1 Tax=unclassified Mesorhizobium TaxID=325217 RepID=UPI0033350BB8
MFDIIWRSIAIGIGATVLMDLWAMFLHLALSQPRPNWGPPGRWVWHFREGKVFHDDIAQAAPYAHEQALGWAFHYVTGIVYGFILVALAGTAWLDAPTFLPAFILGMVTIGAGWFLLAPGMGAGWAASKRPNAMQIRAFNVISHTVFALGLYGTALLIR